MPLPGILGGFETRQKHFFSHFWSQEKNQKNFFPGKIGKNRDLSEIIGIFPKNRRFFAEIFLNDFSMDFSSPLQSITEKSPKNRPIFPTFCSLVLNSSATTKHCFAAANPRMDKLSFLASLRRGGPSPL